MNKRADAVPAENIVATVLIIEQAHRQRRRLEWQEIVVTDAVEYISRVHSQHLVQPGTWSQNLS